MQPPLPGEPHRLLARGLEVLPVLDELRSERPHGGVLLPRIAVRHDDRDREAETPPGEGEALAVIAARRRDEALGRRLAAHERVDIGQAAAHLEGARRLMVLVLDDDLGAEARRKQRPGEGRRRTQGPQHDLMRLPRLVETEHRPRLRRSQTSILPFSSMTLPSSMPASSSSSARIISLCALPDGIIGKQFSF